MTGVELEFLTGNDTLFIIEKRIRGGICHAIYRYAKANNKYMKKYNKNIELSYHMFLDENNLYGWAMFQTLPVNAFKWKKNVSKLDEKLIKNYDEYGNKEYILEADLENPKDLHNLHSDLPFSSKRMKIRKCNKLVCNLYDKKEYVVHITPLKQELNCGLILKKVHRVLQLNQETWLKPYIIKTTKLRIEVKNDFEKDFFKLMSNSVFEKAMENVRKHRDIKLVTTDKRRNQLVSEPNYYTTKLFSKDVLAIEMKKKKVKLNTPVHLGLPILDISKTLMYQFWYDYIKPKYQNNAKLCYMDTDSFIIHIKTENFYKDFADDVKDTIGS